VGTLDEFKKEFPNRFFMEGISEANLIGMAAGLAMEGKIPYVNTIATFLTRRCFEQVALDLCLHNQNVRLIANGGGLVYAPLGPTHEAIDDIAILRVLPNMTIIAPADAEEMKRCMLKTLDHQGPIYIRLGKGYDPVVTTADMGFEIGKSYPMREGEDALIISTGITLNNALQAADQLLKEGIQVSVLHTPTVKPLDSRTILEYASRIPVIVTIEEHSIIGGLGGAVAEIIAEANFPTVKRFKRLGIPDVFPEQYGSQASLMESFDISTNHLIKVIKELGQSKVQRIQELVKE
jgi:transketolase